MYNRRRFLVTSEATLTPGHHFRLVVEYRPITVWALSERVHTVDLFDLVLFIFQWQKDRTDPYQVSGSRAAGSQRLAMRLWTDGWKRFSCAAGKLADRDVSNRVSCCARDRTCNVTWLTAFKKICLLLKTTLSYLIKVQGSLWNCCLTLCWIIVEHQVNPVITIFIRHEQVLLMKASVLWPKHGLCLYWKFSILFRVL